MSVVEVKVPGVGESISEGILSRWLKADGEAVQSGEPLFELETDKASTTIPSPAGGVLKIRAQEGETVAVGATVAAIDPSARPNASATPASRPKPEAAPAPAAAPPTAVGAGPAIAVAPAAQRLAAESGVNPSQVTPTGRGGLVTKEDVVNHLALASAPAESPAAAARQGNGIAVATPPAPAPARSAAGRESRQRMTGIRQRIAQRLLEAQANAAILTTFNEADMSRVMDLRARYKEAFSKKHGIGIGFMSFFVKASIEALKAFPAVNASIDGTDIVYHNYYDIGVAVSTERGLMVPVVRDADQLSFAAVEKAIADYGKKARENGIAVGDLQGGTFTITNGGIFGSLLSTPILNPPQGAILGMHAIQKRPVAVDDQVVIRPMMYLALSYDHRLIDGKEAVSFLVRVKECIENPERLLLEV